ncbi:2-oxoglutarate and Fe(II)-dependent oxygenase superfamily protein [Heracleum sosnowskyi]|uniref:2-oxoglutarate and Fe(II)-dependent oxygenase superfamily protein n=1 Tax=Heracleum sosnowskyi TaxID=360622 RepID=A0AAD8H1X6_9APIA|nr:2-oxoglutarate and Fe(II)-dependent oxygenase superfamily protein [Heracleum sosnowskyi]
MSANQGNENGGQDNSTQGASTKQLHKEYRERIISTYRPLHRELYQMTPGSFFVPSFLNAISENTEEGFRNIISEPSPGVLTFDMLQPQFCKMLVDEAENFENWVRETRTRILRPNTMNAYGSVLDDFGMERMLDKLMKDYILPMSTIFFPEVGGATLDYHHGYVVEYGTNRDDHLDFHVDDSEVTLNVCLGELFTGGEMFFRGVRCDKHLDSESESGEIYNYSQVPGRAVLHCGYHRHGALSTTSGHRANMLLWCRSSVFRDMRKYERNASSWCHVCQKEKEEKQRRFAVQRTSSQTDSSSPCFSQTDSCSP